MIIWISGAYGVGKSTLAEAMAEKLENALIFDAEEVGNAVRENYPDCPYGYIFEDYPLWGEFCYQLLKDIHEKFHKNILVPMTLLRKASYSILEKLSRDGIQTHLIILEASHQTIHDRILSRGEEEGLVHGKYRPGKSRLLRPPRHPHPHRQQDGRIPDKSCIEQFII